MGILHFRCAVAATTERLFLVEGSRPRQVQLQLIARAAETAEPRFAYRRLRHEMNTNLPAKIYVSRLPRRAGSRAITHRTHDLHSRCPINRITINRGANVLEFPWSRQP